MNSARVASMLTNAIGFDTETHKIQPGLLAPPLVVGSLSRWDANAGRVVGGLLEKADARTAFEQLLAGDYTIVGANIAYDMLVMAYDAARRGVDLMPGIFGAYEAARVFDLQIAEALHAIAIGSLGKDPRTGGPLKDPETGKQGRYSLAIVNDLVLGRRDAKVNDRFRQSYALLEDTPIAEWPAEARTYPVDDAINTLEIALAQAGHKPRPAPHRWPSGGPGSEVPGSAAFACAECGVGTAGAMQPCRPRAIASYNLHNLAAQAYAAFAMHLGAAWGFRVDPAAVEALAAKTTKAREAELDGFLDTGLLKLKREPNQVLTPEETKVVRAVTKDTVANSAVTLGMPEPELRAAVAALLARGVLTAGKSTAAIKRRAALAYGCTAPCTLCAGSGKVPSPKTGNLIGCDECDSTGFDLSTAPVPRTETEGVGTSRDALNESGDELLIDFAAFTEDAKILETYIPFLRQGLDEHGNPRPITLRPNVLVDTGRASYGDVVHQLPRGGGVRECIVARPGTFLCSCDYSGLELVTHGQSCLYIVGWSRLAEALNRGIKVHDALAATFLGVTYEEFARAMKGESFRSASGVELTPKKCKAVRQAVKPANFGFPGGMGAVKLVLQQRIQGPNTTAPDGKVYKGLRFCVLLGAERCGTRMVHEWKNKPTKPVCLACVQIAEDIRTKWFRQWPENTDYFKFVADAVEFGQKVARDGREFRLAVGQIMQHTSHRLRGNVEFTNGANGFFQGLAGDGAKRALTRVAREEYDSSFRLPDGSMSPLYGSRTILFAHDELVVEIPQATAHEAASRLSTVMVSSMREFTPDVVCEAPAAFASRWYKQMEPVIHRGRLVEWTPEHNEKTCTECRA